MSVRSALQTRVIFNFHRTSRPHARQNFSSTAKMASPTTDSDPATAPQTPSLRYIDIGINLSDPIFQGISHGKQAHPSDLQHVIQRARDAGVQKMLVTGSDLTESQNAVTLAQNHPNLCFATVGVHPCSANQFPTYTLGGPSALLSSLRTLALESRDAGHALAFGEIGLDYDRLFLTDKQTQLTYFAAQLDLAIELQMPLFLHSRAAAEDFERLLSTRLDKLPRRGVVHSFTGTLSEMQSLVSMGFDIGINGCSMKTEENCAVVKAVPLERIQLETDGPWCEMRPSHASAAYLKGEGAPVLPKAVKKEKWAAEFMVKGRNEPCAMPRVAWAVAGIKGISVEEVVEAAWINSVRMFGFGEKLPQS